jgi:UDP-N-acetylmuramate dehydrogenase
VTERHAVVWPGQPLVLANADGQASGRDIADLAQRITDDIYSKYGVKLETEVEYL